MENSATQKKLNVMKDAHGMRYAETVLAVSRIYALLPILREVCDDAGTPVTLQSAFLDTFSDTIVALMNLSGFAGSDERVIEDAKNLIGCAKVEAIVIHIMRKEPPSQSTH